MLKKIQFPLSLALLVGMLFVWKNIFDKYLPGFFDRASFPTSVTAFLTTGEVKMEAEEKVYQIKEGNLIKTPATLHTLPSAGLIISFGDQPPSKIKLGQSTKVDISKFKIGGLLPNHGLAFDLETGRMLFKINNPSHQKIIKVKTSNFSIEAIEASFNVESFDNSSLLMVKEGDIEVKTADGQIKIIKAGHGLLAEGENLKDVLLKSYKLDWDTENFNTPGALPTSAPVESNPDAKNTIDIANVNIPLTLETELRKMQLHLEDMQTSLPAKIQNLSEDDKKYAIEIDKISQDETCLQNSMQGCEFISDTFKDDIANLKNNPSRLALNANSKSSLLQRMSKAKEDITQKKNDLKNQQDVLQNEIQVESDKLKTATVKIEEYKTATDPKIKTSLLKEISEMLDSAILRAVSNK